MPIIVDAHADLAWNMLTFQRDYTRPARETRQREAGTSAPQHNGDCVLGWEDYQRGQVAIVFSTLFASPIRRAESYDTQLYKNFDEAHRAYRQHAMAYHRLADEHPDRFRIIASTSELSQHLEEWQTPREEGHPVGLVMLMEGAECIRKMDELKEWHELGVRLIGPAWAGTRFCGGTREPGPLTDDGRELLAAMSDYNFILDLSHMDEHAAMEALDRYDGVVVATHLNCLALLPGFPTNRHFTDRALRSIIERNGVIGLVPFNSFLKTGWTRQNSSRAEVTLDDYIAHIDHVCQLAGNARHAAIGTDFDGGFGLQSIPEGLDTIADLQQLAPALRARGYSEADIADIFSGNWISQLKKALP